MRVLLLLVLPLWLLASDLEIKCLTMNIYFEARGSNLADQAAVADVVLNRVASNKYPNTICAVIQQGVKHRNGVSVRNKCQFSWFCDGKSDKMTDIDAARAAYYLAHQMLNKNRFRGITEGSLNYHATYVDPYWAKTFELVGTIGKHKYYRTH